MQIKVEVGVQCLAVSGKTVHHGTAELVAIITQNVDQRVAGFAFMEKDRQPGLHGYCELLFQCAQLVRAR